MSIVFQHMLNTFIYLSVILLLFNLLLVRKQKKIYSYFLLFGVCFVATYITYIYDWFSIVRTMIMFFGALLFFYKGTIPNKILSVMLLLQLMVFLDFLHGMILMMKASVLDYSYFPNNPLPDIYIEIVTIIVLIALNFYRRGKQPLIQYFDKKYILIWILITLNFFLLASVLTSLEFSNQMKGLISAILFLTSGINIYFAYYLEKTRKIFEENLVISKQVEFQENKLAQNKAYLEKNNRLMHDIKKHYLEIEHALSENQMNYVKEYMKGVYQQYFDREHTSFTGNQVVDSMFFSLQEQCQKEDIQLTCDIHIDKKITLAEKDLAVLLGSLFDRAIKAANQTSQERTIKVTMKTEKHHLILAVEYPKEPVTVLPKGTVEQWEDTQIIHRIVEKYSGMYETTERQGTNGISVLLPLK
ncbi:hypothetical protein IGI52_001480 [Enterococcus sp. DIV0187]